MMNVSNMHPTINTKTLRNVATDEVISNLKSLQLELPDNDITAQLLEAIERGSLSTTVFDSWLRVYKSPVVIRHCLRQKVSVQIRFLGIDQLEKGLQSTQWEDIWEGMGGTAGLLEAFSDLSVLEVRSACKAISSSARNESMIHKRERVTELFKGLHPKTFPDTTVKTNDMRPLTKYYQLLVPSCTSELVDWILSEEQADKWQYVKEEKLFETHSASMETQAVSYKTHGWDSSSAREHKSRTKRLERLKQLSTRFPTKPSTEHGFSASMQFALRQLRDAVETGSSHEGDEWDVQNLIRPLLRRAIRKHASWSRIQEIVTLAMAFFDQHPDATKTLTGAKGDLLHMVAICWSRRSALFETQLKRLLHIVKNHTASLGDLGDLLVGVPQSRRYALLRLCCKEVMGVDLDSTQSLSRARGKLSADILTSLDPSNALGLFQRLRTARGDAELVDVGPLNSVLGTDRGYCDGDPDIHFLVLLNRNERCHEAEIYATDIIAARKKATQTTSDRNRRAENALNVWACANASGSIRLFSEIVHWAEGYIRDQLTASRLFSTYYDETYRLLSGFPVKSDLNLTSQALRQNVQQANGILSHLLEIACKAMREPSFRSRDWRKTLDLFSQVIKERVELSSDEISGSEEELYHSLWDDTIAMLLKAERLVNDEEYRKLGAASTKGIIKWEVVFFKVTLDTCGQHVRMFIDNLAKARNDLWAEMRSAKYPEVITLPKGFPRGLPIQYLLPSLESSCSLFPEARTTKALDLEKISPFIFSRVEQTLFMDAETALEPTFIDKSIQQAIGVFVDSYTYALQLYIPDLCEAEVKKQRFSKVWAHAIGPLSAPRMNEEEASRHWKRFLPLHLRRVLSDIEPEDKSMYWPKLPDTDYSSQTQEWNPLDGRPDDVLIEARSLGPATYIDFATLGVQLEIAQPDIYSPVYPPNPTLLKETRSGGSIWASNPHGTGRDATEAAALAALLYLDTKYGATERLLATPFPSSDDVRYPSLYLDEAFLSTNGLEASDAAFYVRLGHVPLPLVHKLATALVQRLGSKHNSPTLQQVAFTLIRALVAGDRPGLAFDLAVKVMMDHPSASSWHRELFNHGFLQRFSASEAKRCISMYAGAIGEKLEARKNQQAARSELKQSDRPHDGDRAADTTQPEGTPIKVTTMKSLAQILQESLYISDKTSLEILSVLSQKATHVDVRVSSLRSFLSKLDINRFELWDPVLSSLAAFIPFIGCMDEREPTILDALGHDGIEKGDSETQQRSEEAQKQSTTIPSIRLATGTDWKDEQPMLCSVLNCYGKLHDRQLADLFVARMIIPILDSFEEQTARWTTLFLRKYASENAEILNMMIPPNSRGLYTFLALLAKGGHSFHRLPQTLLDKFVAHVNFRISPPEAIRKLNQGFEEDIHLKSLPEVQAWLELYGHIDLSIWDEPGLLPLRSLTDFVDGENNSGFITTQTYQEAFLEVFRVLVLADSPKYSQLKAFVRPFSYQSVNSPNHWRPILEAMITHVDKLRTREWKRNLNRTPAVLPDVFPWRLLVLDYPRDWCSGERERKAFAQQLATIVDEISGSVYHEKFELLQAASRRGRHTLPTALLLGDISKTRLSWLTAPELLRVDLAASMMEYSKSDRVEPLEEDRLKALLETWVASENEEVRRKGYRVYDLFFDAKGERVNRNGPGWNSGW
ncbi:hypothetical protein OPT61_g6818 [Boeremia exigua]|uniref:Uncharacterized protein n=1 Tax=Boeremia exigua TaxID=749465 RepID=A0ACC2I5T9_9PLEO|nr:hypothetical protein OPT61_g6818 [Boeremia exigua]